MNRKFCARVAATAVAVLIIASATAVAEEINATLSRIKGGVQVRMAPTGNFMPATDGMRLTEGAAIKSAAMSEAFLTWDGNSLRIGPLTTVLVARLLSDDAGNTFTNFKLERGTLYTKVKKLSGKSYYTIRTSSALAGVRGTGFEATDNSFSVVEGRISVATKDRVISVEAGRMIDLSGSGLIAEPTLIPAAAMKELSEIDRQCAEAPAEETRGSIEKEKAEPAKGKAESEKIEVAKEKIEAEKVEVINESPDKTEPVQSDVDIKLDQISDIVDKTDVVDAVESSQTAGADTCDVDITVKY